MTIPSIIAGVHSCVSAKTCDSLWVSGGYVFLTTLLIAFLTIFGSWRRRSHSLMLKYLIGASYILPPILINYTMGLTEEDQEVLSLVWTTFLLIILGSADCISAYTLEDSESRKAYNWRLLVLYCWVGWQMGRSSQDDTETTVLLSVLFALSLFRTVARSKAWAMASRSYGLVRNTKLIADFMKDESNEDEAADPTCMKGYKYLVKGEKAKMKVKAPHYRTQLETADDHELITIDMIWQCKGRLLSSTGDPDGRLKDICLSYALYRLLCRRFAGYPFSESSQQKTWNFVRYGLLSKGDDHERAFRVIEVELAFLYDLFYTKYPVFVVNGLLWLRNLELVIVIIGCKIMVPVLVFSCKMEYLRDLHYMVTLLPVAAIVALLLMEVGQIFVVNFSDWAKVQWLCYYVKKPSLQNNKCMEMIIQILCHRKAFKPWDRKLGQYSLLESFNHNPCIFLHNSLTSHFIDINRKGQKLSAQITLPVEVKKAIIHSLKTNGQQLTNGVASLQRNGVEDELSWACRLDTQSHVIMVWHIATSFCELNLSSQVIATGEQTNQRRESNDEFIVATKLSKYCAYLVAFAPRLLPGHAYTTEIIFDQVVVEARDKLKGCKKSTYHKMLTSKDDCMKKICQEMLTLGKDDPAEAEEIIERGAILAKQIENIENSGLKWKILAEFWAEMMLFVAPSDDATAHAECLAMGGEFVTHLWALLSHAGILKRDSTENV